TFVMLVVLTPAAAAPLIPAVKSAQCPFGYMQSGGYCMPMSRPAPAAGPKVGKCPPGYGRSGNACFDLPVRLRRVRRLQPKHQAGQSLARPRGVIFLSGEGRIVCG